MYYVINLMMLLGRDCEFECRRKLALESNDKGERSLYRTKEKTVEIKEKIVQRNH